MPDLDDNNRFPAFVRRTRLDDDNTVDDFCRHVLKNPTPAEARVIAEVLVEELLATDPELLLRIAYWQSQGKHPRFTADQRRELLVRDLLPTLPSTLPAKGQ